MSDNQSATDVGVDDEDDNEAEATVGTSPAEVIATLGNGVVYEVRVVAFDADDTRLRLSNIVEVTPNQTPVGVFTLKAEGVEGGIELTYDFPTGVDPTGGTISSWQYRMRAAADLGADNAAGGTGDDVDTQVVEWDATGDDAIPWMDIPGGADSSPYNRSYFN